MHRILLVALALLLAGCADPAGPAPTQPRSDASQPPPALRLEPVYEGLEMPLLLTHAGDESGRVFLVEQGGIVRVARNGTLLDAPFLDVTDLTRGEGERGLLGLAFPPEFPRDARVYVSHTDLEGDSVLARYRVEGDAVLPETREVLLTVAQPYANHNGGHLVFGPDGYLYYGLGDGGAAGDPHGNGQDPHALLGSLLRLDVSPAEGYEIPPTNPYADGQGGAREVWAKGLRNPWRFSFDVETNDLYIADVGQNEWEEVNVVPNGTAAGANFGWAVYEGGHRFKPFVEPFSATINPVAEYSHEATGGCSVTGGHVYRGDGVPALQGIYLFADYCSGVMYGLRNEDGAWRSFELLRTDARVSSFGVDETGEMYVVDHGGRVLRIVEDEGAAADQAPARPQTTPGQT